jgi:hypothetical protein
MSRRLTDHYRIGDPVEIQFADDSHNRWWLGRVVRPSPPGLWVMTEDGQQWFVTNNRRIRRRSSSTLDERDKSGRHGVSS